MSLAACTALLTLTSLVLVSGVYDGREERSIARAPREASFFPSETITFGFLHRFTTFEELPLSVNYVDPVSSNVPPPPGLTQWPDPGTYVSSPSLDAYRLQLDELYGTYAGTIDAATLGSPEERLVYVRPAAHIPRSASWSSGTGFGNPNNSQYSGEIWYVQPAFLLMSFLTVFVILPAVVLFSIVAAIVARRTMVRAALLEALGMPPRTLMWQRWRECLPATIVATAIAAGVIIGAGLINVPLPGAGYTLNHEDVRRVWPAAFGVLATGFCAMNLACLAALYPRKLRSGNRPRAHNRPISGWITTILALASMLIGLMAIQSARAGESASVLWFFAGTAVTLVAMAWITGWLLHASARGLTHIGHRQVAPAALLVGRHLAATSRQASRLAYVIAAIVFLTCQIAIANHLGNSDAQTARQVFAHLDGRVATIGIPGSATPYELTTVLDALPTDSPVAEISVDHVQDPHTGAFTAPVTITTVPNRPTIPGLPPPGVVPILGLPDPLPLLLGQESDASTVTIQEGELQPSSETASAIFAVLATNDTPITADQLQVALNKVTAPGWTASSPGASWRNGAAIAEHQSRWIVWMGSIAAAMLLAAAWLATHEATRAAMAQLTPLTAFTGRKDLIWRVIALRMAMIVIIGYGVASIIAFHYGNILPALGLDRQTSQALLALAVPVVLTGAISIWATVHATISAMATWKPGRTPP